MNKDLQDTIYLMGCALNRKDLDRERINQMNLENIYHLSMKHMIASLVVTALLDSGKYDSLRMSPEISAKWKKQRDLVIRQTMVMDYERNKIFSYMESAGIWYLPLKGILLKDFYPQIGMRQMSDNDILFDRTRKKDVVQYMEGAGYSRESSPISDHLDFKKLPLCHFELHTTLMNESESRWMSYSSDVSKRLVKDKGNKFGYHFTDEDFYLFMVIHSYKHYSHGGTGLRTLADWYVYLSAKKDALNWKFIDSELEKYSLSDYERTGRTLSEKLFSVKENEMPDASAVPELSREEADMLNYIGRSGVYGFEENKFRNGMKEIITESGTDGRTDAGIKWKYYWRRIAPPLSWYEVPYPFLYRHRYFIPFFVVGRFFYALLFKRGRIKNEMAAIDDELSKKESDGKRPL
jgi:hypothetical protein